MSNTGDFDEDDDDDDGVEGSFVVGTLLLLPTRAVEHCFSRRSSDSSDAFVDALTVLLALIVVLLL